MAAHAVPSLALGALESMMSRGQNPLIWMMALSLPTAGHALGLGEIHVDSALNEPLSAEIDIVGATPEELSGITASVANHDTFMRFGAERHNFLQSTSFKVSQDAHGRPVLAISSTESFNEPLVDLVVDLRWRNGELIRQYALLLDPAGFPSAARAAEPLATPASPAVAQAPMVSPPRPHAAAQTGPVIPTPAARPVANPAPSMPASELGSADRKTFKVGAKATLRGIAWRVGARSRPDINRLMLAIFRANPAAFDGNINRLHLGAQITIPSSDEVAAIPQADANREIRSQMSSWLSTWKGATLASTASRADAPGVPASTTAAAPASPVAVKAAPPAATVPNPTAAAVPQTAPAQAQPSAPAVAVTPQQAATKSAAPANGAKSVDDMNNAELADRVQQLENSLREVQAQLDSEHGKMLNMQSQVRFAEQQRAVAPKETQTGTNSKRSYLGVLIGGVAVLLGALGAFILRSRRNAPPRPNMPREPLIEPAPVPLAPPVAQKHTYASVVPAPVAPVRAPVAAQHVAPVEARTRDDSMMELSQLEPSDLSTELGIDAPADASTADTHEIDTRGADAARLREDAAATRMREELEAAWSIPAAETYQRFDETESTLAEAIEKSLVETARVRVAQPAPVDLIDLAETNRVPALDSTSTLLGPGETMAMGPDTTKLPAATLAMHADEIARAFEEPTVTQPRPDPNQLDYNLLDLDQLEELALPDSLHDHVVVKEPRLSPIDALKRDLQREPDRDDLRLQALETYVAQAAAGREYAQVIDELTDVRELLSEAEWHKANQLVQQSTDRPSSADHLPGDDDDLMTLDRRRA